jgi:hypothetical protein
VGGQRLGHPGTHALPGAGHEGDATGEIEQALQWHPPRLAMDVPAQ